MSTWMGSTCVAIWVESHSGSYCSEVVDAAEGMKEDKARGVSFFQWLRGRGMDGVKLIVGDKYLGIL